MCPCQYGGQYYEDFGRSIESRSALDQNTSWVIVRDNPGEEFYSMFFLRVPSWHARVRTLYEMGFKELD